MSNLEHAILIATQAHAGSVDKGGHPYILHPLRVMLSLSTAEERIVGVLHDVCEDCPGWDFERLRSEGFSEAIVAALDSVTKRENESYDEFVLRSAQNSIGRRVKMADLADNCDLSRIANATEGDHQRITKYRRALALIA